MSRPVRIFRLIALVLAAGLLAALPGTADAQTRTLSFKQVHTGETLTVTYMRNGRYDPDAMAKINYILRDWRRNETTRMDPRLIDTLWEAHERTGSREPINVLSGYRSPVTNAMLRSRSRGVAKHSQHMLGKATDFFLPDVPLAKLRATGLKMEHGGVGYYPTSGSPFVHLDVGSVRHWPRMTRKQLLAVFPDGNTVHIPSDGKPLAKYEVARARVDSGASSASTTVASLTTSPGRPAGRDPSRVNTRSDIVLAGEPAPRRRTLIDILTGDEEEDNAESGVKSAGAPAATPTEDSPAAPEADAGAVVLAAVPVPSRRPDAGVSDEALSAAADPILAAMAIPSGLVHMPESKPGVLMASADTATGSASAASMPASLTALIPPAGAAVDDPIARALGELPGDQPRRQTARLIAPDYGAAAVSALIRASAVTRSAASASAAWRIENAFDAFGSNLAEGAGRFTGPAVRAFEQHRVMRFRAG